MSLFNKGIYQSQPYYKEMCNRVLSNKEFKRLNGRLKKDKYINLKNIENNQNKSW